MIKIRIHPAFWVFAIILVFENQFVNLIAALVAIIIHETAHARVAYNCGYYMNTVTLMPFGAMLGAKDDFSGMDGVKIAYAGPASNFLTCIILFAIWWIYPTAYNYTQPIYHASIAIGTFNLLPLFPLDGARILLSISKNPIKLLTVLKGIGIAVSSTLGMLFLISFFYSPNLTLGMMGTFLYIAQNKDSENERYKLLLNNCPYLKKIDAPIKKCTMVVHYNLKLLRLLKHIRSDSEIIFEVVNDNFKPVKIITENDVRQLAIKENLHKPIKELLYL